MGNRYFEKQGGTIPPTPATVPSTASGGVSMPPVVNTPDVTAPPAPAVAPDSDIPYMRGEVRHKYDLAPGAITQVVVDAIIGGCLMRLTFGPGTDPAAIPALLKTWDPAVKTQAEFPRSGGGGWGKRDTKKATAFVLTGNPERKTYTITARTPEGETISAFASEKSIPDMRAALEGLGCLSPANLATVAEVFDHNRPDLTLALAAEEQFTVEYSTSSKDGRHFVEALSATLEVAS